MLANSLNVFDEDKTRKQLKLADFVEIKPMDDTDIESFNQVLDAAMETLTLYHHSTFPVLSIIVSPEFILRVDIEKYGFFVSQTLTKEEAFYCYQFDQKTNPTDSESMEF